MKQEGNWSIWKYKAEGFRQGEAGKAEGIDCSESFLVTELVSEDTSYSVLNSAPTF